MPHRVKKDLPSIPAGSGEKVGGPSVVSFPSRDGFPLTGSLYRPEHASGPVRAALVASAVGVRRRFYDPFSRFLQQEGWTVVTLDYRGIGDSGGHRIREVRGSLLDWGTEDLHAALDWMQTRLEPERLVLVGHSVGGQLLPFTERFDRIRRTAFIAATTPFWSGWKGWRKLRLIFFWFFLIPFMNRLFGYLPMKKFALGENLPFHVARQWARWGRKQDYVNDKGESLCAEFANVKLPILALSFSDDQFYAPRRAVENLLRLYTAARIEHRHVEPGAVGAKEIGHFGFFREGSCPGLWKEVSDWLAQD